jgi:hypothetical protein
MLFKKVLLFCLFFVSLFFIIFAGGGGGGTSSSTQTQYHNPDSMPVNKILSPLGESIYTETDYIAPNSNSGQRGSVFVLSNDFFLMPDFFSTSKGSQVLRELSYNLGSNEYIVCKRGGFYTLDGYKYLSESSFKTTSCGKGCSVYHYKPVLSKVNQNYYYCKTTMDLVNEIKVPNNWKNSNILLHCNDGKYELDFNIEKYLNLNVYKSCFVKNLDLKEDNVIYYVFGVGNYELEKKRDYSQIVNSEELIKESLINVYGDPIYSMSQKLRKVSWTVRK